MIPTLATLSARRTAWDERDFAPTKKPILASGSMSEKSLTSEQARADTPILPVSNVAPMRIISGIALERPSIRKGTTCGTSQSFGLRLKNGKPIITATELCREQGDIVPGVDRSRLEGKDIRCRVGRADTSADTIVIVRGLEAIG